MRAETLLLGALGIALAIGIVWSHFVEDERYAIMDECMKTSNMSDCELRHLIDKSVEVGLLRNDDTSVARMGRRWDYIRQCAAPDPFKVGAEKMRACELAYNQLYPEDCRSSQYDCPPITEPYEVLRRVRYKHTPRQT